MITEYTTLKKQIYTNGIFKIVPIRHEDRIAIMQWRNEQIYHLRQSKPLTIEDQDNYFENVVPKLFEQTHPNQLLFSFLKDDVCIGYGGLVHINWIDKNAEISFIMETLQEETKFHKNWSNFLPLIEEVAFTQLKFHKLYVFAFDLRPHLYKVLISNNYFKDAVLKDHCFFDNRFIDVVIHSKINA
jgi:RimJ/RimL family protein N-acetyltransferase